VRITPNPFRWNQTNLKLFYGRHQLAAELISELLQGHSAAVVGGRRIGKTTLLRKIERDLVLSKKSSLAAGSLNLPVYVDILDLPHPISAKTIYTTIIQELERGLKDAGLLRKSHPSALSVFEEFPREENRAFKQIIIGFIEEIKNCFFRAVVLIDEIEPITRSDWADGFFSNWRHLLSNEPMLSQRISAVFSGAKEMTAIARDVGSPLANILAWRELSLFSWQDTAKLINEPTDGLLPASVARRIFNWTGGHPFLIQYVMHYICRFNLEEAEVRLNEALRQFLIDHAAQFHSWWFEKFSDEDRRVYAYLADYRQAVPKRNVIRFSGDVAANKSLAILCHTGVVRKLERREFYKVAGLMFKNWFRRHGSLTIRPSVFDANIYEKLRQLAPEIASKYVTAWSIYTTAFPNYSGAVSELRDVVTLVLHNLAPDEQVKSQPGYSPDKGGDGKPLTKPTRKQRTDFIMRNKGVHDTGAINAEINLLNTLIDQLAHVVSGGYGHASARTHTVATRDQAWKCLKQLDSILAQLL
jgi:hypothetical protein